MTGERMTKDTTGDERLSYRPGETAKLLGCSRDLVFQLLASGELRSWKINTARFISADEIHRFIREREQESEV